MPGATQVSKPALVKGVRNLAKPPLGLGVYHQATAMVFCLKAAGRLRRMSGSRRSGEEAPAEAL